MRREKSQIPQNPSNNERVAELLRLANEAAAGHLDELECPECQHSAISVWFTHPSPEVYRTWFICGDCGFHTRAQLADKPPYFTESRVSTDLEERDLLILKQAKFKRPPQKLM